MPMNTNDFETSRPLRHGTILRNNIDAYQIIGEAVNAGGFGRIYRAKRISDGDNPDIKKYAIKEFFVGEYCDCGNSIISNDLYLRKNISLLRSKFIQEAKLLAEIGCMRTVSYHIPEIFSRAFKTDDGLFYAMEYVEGPTLTQEVKNWGTMHERRARPLIVQISRLLWRAHTYGIIHSDITPNNIILRGGGTIAVLVDFGNARSYEDVLNNIPMDDETREKCHLYKKDFDDAINLMGDLTVDDMNEMSMKITSEGFSAPESLRGKPAGDIYSLVMVLYFLLTGLVPTPSNRENMLVNLTNKGVSERVIKIIMEIVDGTKIPTAGRLCNWFIEMRKD